MRDRVVDASFALLAIGLLGATLLWYVPMMLWDHLDLVPIYQAWQQGALHGSDFWSIHGGHLHSAAYAVLLATTSLSNGQTLLDCLLSLALLLGFAVIVMRLAKRTFGEERDSRRWLVAMAFLALYPGHLANLQWGWQVAVFLCLVGVAVSIACLGAAQLSWRRNAAALVATACACLSFATGIALIPVAVAIIVLRPELSTAERLRYALPWALFGLLVLAAYQASSLTQGASHHSPFALLHYVLNFLGAGVSRFATDAAAPLASVALVTGVHAFGAARRARGGMYWMGLFLFAIFGALLTAVGRAPSFGADHAFVTRYVSFSTLFWMGWLGLMVIGSRIDGRSPGKWRKGLVAVIAAFGVVNAAHMIKQAARVAEDTRSVAAQIRATYPNVDTALLGKIYFEQPAIARERLRALHGWGFAPFDEAVDNEFDSGR